MNEDNLIKKWLADELTDTELSDFKKLEDYHLHQQIIEGAQHFKAPIIDKASGIKEVISKKSAFKQKPKNQNNWYKPLLQIAAILVFILSISFFLFKSDDTEISTLIGQKREIQLPDYSTVIVNSKSEISFDKKNWEENRKISLDGEAYFKVENGSTFRVKTNQGTITVLGTQFNVKNRDNFFEVTCYEGLVNVIHEEHRQKLPQGNTIRIMNGNITSETISDIHPQWIKNISSFRSVPFYEVIREFERQYNTTFDIRNIDQSRLFTGGFMHDNMENALKSITSPLNLTYSFDASKKIILQNKQ